MCPGHSGNTSAAVSCCDRSATDPVTVVARPLAPDSRVANASFWCTE